MVVPALEHSAYRQHCGGRAMDAGKAQVCSTPFRSTNSQFVLPLTPSFPSRSSIECGRAFFWPYPWLYGGISFCWRYPQRTTRQEGGGDRDTSKDASVYHARPTIYIYKKLDRGQIGIEGKSASSANRHRAQIGIERRSASSLVCTASPFRRNKGEETRFKKCSAPGRARLD